jgi:secondary thiamine-phosphate synthase enzyme
MSTKAVICPHCGGENFGTKIKCHHCGKLLADVPVEVDDKHPAVGKSVIGVGGKMRADEFTLETNKTVNDITDKVRLFAQAAKMSGLVNVFLPHATAGVALMETGSGSEEDLDQVLARLAPADNRYTHHHGSKGHGRDHLIPVFVSPSMMIPVDGGRLALGQWQSIVVIDSNLDNGERRVRLSFIPGELPAVGAPF